MLDAFISVIPPPGPENWPAVIIPVAFIEPNELIPTPPEGIIAGSTVSGFLPTVKMYGNEASVVPIPTDPFEYILTYADDGSTSTHWDVGILVNVDPSP